MSAQTARKGRKPVPPTKSAAPAETPAAAATAWPIGNLKVEGNKLYSAEKILAVAGLKVGQMAGKAEFDAARDRLLASGAFESVGYRFDPIAGTRTNLGTFKVDEITQLFPYRFEELRVDEAALRAHLKGKEVLFEDKVPGTQPILDRMTKEIQEFTKLPDKVQAKLEGAGNLTIVFRPSNLPSVGEVYFKGNTAIPTAKLQQVITGAGIGAVFTENRFRQILDASVRPAYEQLGHLRVQFPKFDVSPAKNVNGIAITVHVNEGPVYKLADVELKGELEENKELLKIGGFQSGDVADFTKIRAGVEDIGRALRRKGYLESKVSSDRKLNDTEKTVTLIVDVEPGPQFTMGKLTIEGLDVETEPHIRKLWALKRGQLFNAEYPNFFLAKLVEDQILDNLGKTNSTTTQDPERKTVDVTLLFEGDKKKSAKPPVP